MIRPATLVAVVLGFLTALAVGQLGWLMNSPDIADSRATVQVQGVDPVVEAFYQGMNDWIATGDRSLEFAITPNFVDHTLSADPDRGGEALFNYLSALRTAVPSLRFDVLGVESSGTIISVDVSGEAGALPSIEGWSIDRPEQQSFREILRIEGDQIAERWSADVLWPRDMVSIERTLPVGVEAYHQPSLQQFTLEPMSAFDLVASGTVILWVESGELEIEITGWDEMGSLRSPTEPLAPGTMRIVKPTGEMRLRAMGSERVDLLTISLHTILIPSGTISELTNDLPSGIRQNASVSLSMQLTESAVRLSARVLTLPPGATVSMNPASLHEILVIGGALQGESETGDIFFCFDRSRSRLLTGPQTALSGQGFATQSGRPAIFQVIGSEPTTLLLLTILPANSTPTQPIRTGQA